MLKNKIMGMEFKNPIVVSAGPWSRGYKKIMEALDAGAGAVVTESIVNETNPDLCPRFAYDGTAVQNIRMYSDLEIEIWIDELKKVIKERKKEQGLVIASIMADTPSEMVYLAKKIKRTGVDAIELGTASPIGEGAEVAAYNAERVFDLTEAVVESIDIPVIVKLAQGINNLPEIVHAVERAKASGISAIDTVRCILSVDIETGKPILPTYGGYSGTPIKPMGLATVAGIVQSTKLPVIGIGGIDSYRSLLEYIMVGASAVGIGTAIMLNGYAIIPKIAEELKGWMTKHDIENIDDIRGITLEELRAFEELKVEPKTAWMKSTCNDRACNKCVNCCMDKAVQRNKEEIAINNNSCTGCGLCIDVCPKKIIELRWGNGLLGVRKRPQSFGNKE